jgi:hypothetical protein
VRGNLPQSLLGNVYNEVAAGIVQAHLNVPYGQLMGQDSGEASYSQDSGPPRGTLTRGESRTFRHVLAPIKAILRGARSKYPAVTKADLMVAHDPPPPYSISRSCWPHMGPAWITYVSGPAQA